MPKLKLFGDTYISNSSNMCTYVPAATMTIRSTTAARRFFLEGAIGFLWKFLYVRRKE